MTEDLKVSVAELRKDIDYIRAELKSFRTAAWVVGLGAVALVGQKVLALAFTQP